eukprot:scaffold103306_cov60-Phaeocystis_antarctica.AAC.2
MVSTRLGHDEGARLGVGHAIGHDHLIAARWDGEAACEGAVGPGQRQRARHGNDAREPAAPVPIDGAAAAMQPHVIGRSCLELRQRHGHRAASAWRRIYGARQALPLSILSLDHVVAHRMDIAQRVAIGE